jgi:DNA-binding PadR family transcriptional regulator
VLSILRKEPKNGAEIMDQVEQMSLGWRPSPGSVYPLLEELRTEGLIRQREDGRYELTSQGRDSMSGPWDFFASQSPTLEGIVNELRSNVSYLEDLRSSSPSKLDEHRKVLAELGARLQKIGGG